MPAPTAIGIAARPVNVQLEMDRLVENGVLLRRLGDRAFAREQKSLGRALYYAGDKVYARWKALASQYPC